MSIFEDGEKMPGVIGLLGTWLDLLKRSSRDRPVIVCVLLQADLPLKDATVQHLPPRSKEFCRERM